MSDIFFSSPALGTTTHTAWMGNKSKAAEPTSVPGPKPVNQMMVKQLTDENKVA